MVVNIKKAKGTKKCVIIRKLKFENYKSSLEVTQIKNKINHIEQNKINIDSPKKNHKEFIRNNKSILKAQQRFKTDRHIFFTEEIIKIAF